MTSPLFVPLPSSNGVSVSINPNAIESVRPDGSDAIVRMASGAEHRVRAASATPKDWTAFVSRLGVRIAGPKGAA